MENDFVLIILSIFLTPAVVAVYFFYRFKTAQRALARSQHEYVSTLIHIDGLPTRVDYSQIPRLWDIYRKESPGGYHVFVESVSNTIARQIKQYPIFEKVVDHFVAFDNMMENKKTSLKDKELVQAVHKKVSTMTVSRVASLAQSNCHRIWFMPNTKEKVELKYRFKTDLSLLAFTNYYPFSYDLFLKEEKERPIKGKQEKKKIISTNPVDNAKVIEIKSATG